MQTNSYFLPSYSSENSHFLSNSNLTQMQNFTNTKIAQENYANGNTNTNMNTNFLHEVMQVQIQVQISYKITL
jgi:hypothetical protein